MEKYKAVRNFAIPTIIAALLMVVITPIYDCFYTDFMAAMENAEAAVAPAQIIPFIAMALLSLAISMAMTVFGLIWLYFAAKNKFELGFGATLKTAEGREIKNISAVWSVVWLLIPVANIVMWYFILKQIWFASNLKPYNDKSCPWNFLRAYWLLIFLSMAASIGILYACFPWGAAPEEMRAALTQFNWAFMILNAANVTAFNLLAVYTIVKITKAQKRAFTAQNAGRQ